MHTHTTGLPVHIHIHQHVQTYMHTDTHHTLTKRTIFLRLLEILPSSSPHFVKNPWSVHHADLLQLRAGQIPQADMVKWPKALAVKPGAP